MQNMFAQTLKDITSRLTEVHCIFLMGMDGMPIDKVVVNNSLNIDMLTAEFTAVLRNTMQTSREVGAGSLDELMVLSNQLVLVMKAITPEYFLMMILPEDANIGRARFELKKAKYVLEKEFE